MNKFSSVSIAAALILLSLGAEAQSSKSHAAAFAKLKRPNALVKEIKSQIPAAQHAALEQYVAKSGAKSLPSMKLSKDVIEVKFKSHTYVVKVVDAWEGKYTIDGIEMNRDWQQPAVAELEMFVDALKMGQAKENAAELTGMSLAFLWLSNRSRKSVDANDFLSSATPAASSELAVDAP